MRFLYVIEQRLPFPLRAIQVDGGSEFQGEFEQACRERGVRLFALQPHSPKLNGYVECGHRTHQEEFYDNEWPVAATTPNAPTSRLAGRAPFATHMAEIGPRQQEIWAKRSYSRSSSRWARTESMSKSTPTDCKQSIVNCGDVWSRRGWGPALLRRVVVPRMGYSSRSRSWASSPRLRAESFPPRNNAVNTPASATMTPTPQAVWPRVTNTIADASTARAIRAASLSPRVARPDSARSMAIW